jgi:tetratricopeptide (TPR) repeat protein
VRRIALALALLTFAPQPAARADWEVKRSPFDPALVARYKQLLRKSPDDAGALQKLVELYKKYRSLDQLATELKQAGTPPDWLVLGHLERERGHDDEATRWYEKAYHADEKRAAAPLADQDVRLKRLDDARKLYLEASKLAAGDKKRLAALLRKRIDLEVADPSRSASERAAACGPLFEQLLALTPDDEAARAQWAELESKADPKHAAQVWHGLADRHREDPARRGQALLTAGRYEEAAEAWKAALATYDEVYALAPKGHYLRREAMQRIVDVHRKLDDLRALAEKWEKAWPASARGFDEWQVLASLWDELGDAPRAEEAFKRALLADPHQIETRKRLIALYERGGRDGEALAELRKLVQSAPGEPRFRLELAERLWKAEPHSKEAIGVAHGVGKETRDPSVHQALAELYTRWGLTDDALAEREKLVQLEPNEEAHLVNLGELYWTRGKKDRALETWKRILSLKSDKREKLEARVGDVFGEHDLPAEALDAYQRAARLAPNDLTIQKGLAGALERQHRDAEAETLWEQVYERAAAAKQRALALEVRQRLISTLVRMNRLNAKLPGFRQKLDQAGDDETRATWGLLAADGYLRLGRPDEAERVLTQLTDTLKAAELRGEAFLGLAQVLKARHRYKEAIAALQKAAELAPARARELYAQIAELSLQLYRDSDALTFAKKAVELGPGDASAHLRLAEVLEKRDQIDEAAAQYRRALELNDRQWKVYFVLARLELRRGEYASAARLYREIIRRAPEEELVVDAARRAIDLDEYLGSLGELERELAPLSYAHPDRRVVRDLLVDLYSRHAPPLVARSRLGDAAARAELTRLGEHGLRPLLEVLSPPGDQPPAEVNERRMAAMLLGEFGNPSAVEPLLKLAQAKKDTHGNPAPIELRVEAAVSAARLAGPKDAAALARLTDDGEKLVRSAALWGLGRVRAPAAEAALEKALGDSTAEAQALACIGLARQKSTRAVASLTQLVRDRARPELARAAGAWALGVLADVMGESAMGPARAALAEVLAEGGDEPQRKAAWALGRLGAKHAAATLLGAVFVRRDGVRRMAIEALAGSGDITVGEPERAPLGEGGGLDVRAWVAALGGPGRTSAPASVWRGLDGDVAHALDDALSRHRDLQLRALADLDARGDGLALGPLTSGPLSSADHAALDQLGEKLRPVLERLTAKGDAGVRAAAVHVLGKVRGGLPTVIRAIGDPAPEVRLAALDALGGVEDAPRPAEATQAAALGVAQAVAQAVGRTLGSRDWRERRAALAALPASNAIAAASAALDDADGFVREAAARALGKACAANPAHGAAGSCTSTVELLVRHAADEAPRVRAAVAAALARSHESGHESKVNATLDRLRHDPDPEVRSAAGD